MKLARALIGFGMLLALPGGAGGHEHKTGTLVISHPWIRATTPGITITAGYARITNTGKAADRLVGASLKSAAKGELHSTTTVNGVAKMRSVPNGIAIPAGKTVDLGAAGFHFMFSGLSAPLEAENYLPGTLVFEKAGEIAVEFFVEPLGQNAPHHH
jgi:copper(I)-binding protein